MRPRQTGDDSVLKLIHASMLGGTLVLFAVAFFLYGGREPGEVGAVVRWAWLAVAVAVVFAVGAVRGRLHRNSDEAQVRMSGIVIWALAEGAALVGIVSTIMTGHVVPAIGATLIGVFLMLHHRPSQLG
ncbi:MAG: hypothetical protein ACC682_00585 [Gemmatimonadota bacterium]